MSLERIVTEGAAAMGISLPAAAPAAFAAYYEYLSKMNQVMDLTAVEGPKETAERHFLDSLSLLPLLPEGPLRIIDVGSGAGFPGLPLKLARPEISLTLLDAQQKRVDFLCDLCRELGVSVTCIHARAEEQALKPDWRDSFDAAVSRAVARLNQLSELTLPFVKTGGLLLAMKASDSDEEISEAANAIQTLGGAPAEIQNLTVAGIPRKVVLVRKAAATPAGYPRRFARIQKKPL